MQQLPIPCPAHLIPDTTGTDAFPAAYRQAMTQHAAFVAILVAKVRGGISQREPHGQLTQITDRAERAVVRDLSDGSFCNSAGLTMLPGARHEAERATVVPVVACVPIRAGCLLVRHLGADLFRGARSRRTSRVQPRPAGSSGLIAAVKSSAGQR
ncbi:hypothetical protein [Streptomyces olivochromogenes]|uniref:hypothetical protein n=1 Tax=Streptomyces olivochromogenes TaxID=1963 RepID=UPI001F3F63CF|nr:hypothetical protein [Streptomyces olivochromogenes]MCF3137426.1 hypothetical protein [Streptomyces olivochromogenes]